jgi:CRISP-associated protein Cas1
LRAVVDAKVRKQIVLLQRFARRDNAEAVLAGAGQMERLLAMPPDCGTRDELVGIEGAAAREYFTALAQIVPEDMRF